MAAKARLVAYPGWHTGSGLEEFYGTNTSWNARRMRQAYESSMVPFVIEWLSGTKLYIYPDDESCRVIYFTGLYEPNEFLFLSKMIRPGMTFIDAGANMGLYSLFAASITGTHGQVISLEPSSREFERLVANCRLNTQLSIRPLKVALSDRPGTAELLVAENDHAGHNTLGSFAYQGIKVKQTETVPINSLDKIIESLAVTSVDIIKMDIEGSELFALRGSASILERFKPILLIELFDMALTKQGCDAKMVAQFLDGLGYELFEFGGADQLVPLSVSSALSRNVVGLHRSAVATLGRRIQFG